MSEVIIEKKEFDEVFEKMCDEYCRFPFVLETQELSEQELIRSVLSDFYLTDHDFNVYVNKGCQTYDMTPEEMFDNAIVWEVYKEMQRGGCNEKRSNNDF